MVQKNASRQTRFFFFFLKFLKPKRASYFIPSPEFYALQNS